MKSFIFTMAVCLAGMASEAVLAGKDANTIMKSLKQPPWALPTWAWYFVGVAYYAGCFVSLYRLSSADSATRMRSAALALVLAVMAANAGWNFIFFRRRDLALSFWFFLPYTLLVLALVYTLSRINPASAAIFVVYLLYLPYALIWSYRTWKLNQE
jgi:tryptophan-rich sensory protein